MGRIHDSMVAEPRPIHPDVQTYNYARHRISVYREFVARIDAQIKTSKSRAVKAAMRRFKKTLLSEIGRMEKETPQSCLMESP